MDQSTRSRDTSVMVPVLRLDRVARRFGPRLAVAGVSFALPPRGSLGILGESGSGKTTVARIALGLLAPDSGSVAWQGVDLAQAPAARLRELRRGCQAVFQDPVASLHPRKRLLELVAEAARDPPCALPRRSRLRGPGGALRHHADRRVELVGLRQAPLPRAAAWPGAGHRLREELRWLFGPA